MARTQTTHAAAAKQIRAILASTYPTVAFRVTSKGYSGGNNVVIHWTDGPTRREVEEITKQYQYGSFDGMQDLYEYTNSRDDIPQVRWVQHDRSTSDEAKMAMVNWLNTRFGWELRLIERTSMGQTWLDVDHETDKHTGYGWQSHEINRYMNSLSLVHDCGAHTLPGDLFCPQCGDSIEEHLNVA
jgi:hypothetical protein